MFSLKYEVPIEKFEKWDSNEVYTEETTAQRCANIKDFYEKIQPYIDSMEVMTFQNHLDRINYCLSVAMLQVSEQ